ncbi:MAG TPA: ABC transporter permease [Bacteroidales bacterium]|nr:ABC transporter permease [Bacteroidales bacterium]
MKNNTQISENYWTEVILPHSSWFNLKLTELWHYRDLIMLFVRRDIVAVYKQTILGPLWYIIQPILTTLVFTIVFGNIARLSTDGLPPVLFYLAGVVGWQYFSNCIIKTSYTFINNAQIFGKVYFPRLTVPISIVISSLLTFTIQFLLFLIFVFYYYLKGVDIKLTSAALMLPLLVLIMALLGLGLGIIISSLTTKYRDLQFLVAFGVQLFMYATPIIWPISSIPEKWKMFLIANPMAPIIEAIRYGFLGSGSFTYCQLIYSTIFSIVIFFIGVILFNKVEKNFMDTV